MNHNAQTETFRIAAWNALLNEERDQYEMFCDWLEIARSIDVSLVVGGDSVLKFADATTKNLD